MLHAHLLKKIRAHKEVRKMEVMIAGVLLAIVIIIITGYTICMYPEDIVPILLIDLIAILQFINENIK